MAPAKTIINIYSEQRQIGKNNMISHLVANYGAVVLTGTSLEADKKKILDNYQLTDEQARTGSLTPFQQKPILIVSLASNDARLQEPKFYNNLEILSDGEWLLDGAWGTSPWIFVLGNDKLNPKGKMALSAGRMKCYHIASESHDPPFAHCATPTSTRRLARRRMTSSYRRRSKTRAARLAKTARSLCSSACTATRATAKART